MSKVDKFVDISNLPKKNDKIIDWEKSVGKRCSFYYGGITGKIEIVDYIPSSNNNKYSKLILSYNVIIGELLPNNFRNGVIGGFLKKHTVDFKYAVGDIVHSKNNDLILLDRFYVKKDGRNRKHYKYRCLTCGYEGETTESIILQNKGCPACAGKVVVVGLNDIPTTEPWMIDFFQGGIDEAKQYTKGSTKKIVPKCPVCGRVMNKSVQICSLYSSHKCGCKCDTYMSFPEQVLYNLLLQFDIDFIHEASENILPWAKKYKYDFYIPSLNCIVETHGGQHYGHGFENIGGKTLKEQQLIDLNKKQLAIDNKISYYFEIDCRHSDIEWILSSLEESRLFEILSIQTKNININSLYKSILKTKIDLCKKILDKEPNQTLSDLSRQLSVSSKVTKDILNILC